MKSPNGQGGVGPSTQDPVRWADMPAETLGPLGKLLVSPPQIKALPSDVAMRVRANVLRSPAPSAGASEAGSVVTRHAASLKLGGIAVGAALFGAGAMTALSSAQDPSALRVVIAPMAGVPSDGAGGVLRHAVGKPTANQASNATLATEHVGVREGTAPSAHGDSSQELSDAQRVSLASRSLSARDDGFANEAIKEAPSPNRETASQPWSIKERDVRSTVSGTVQLPNVNLQPQQAQDVSSEQEALNRAGDDQDLELMTEAEVIDRPVVRPQFRRVTTARKPLPRTALSSLEEETRLLEEARSKLGRAPEAALVLALDHQSRFRQGQLLEQRRMIHLEALLRLGRDEDAKKLASSIGSSIYQARANALLVRYGIVTN